MNLNEFKAWFEGFCEAISDTPTPQQWNRIKEVLKNITLEPISLRVTSTPVSVWPPVDFSPATLPVTPKIWCQSNAGANWQSNGEMN